MANWYVSSVAYTAVTTWSAAEAVTVGTLRRPTAPTVGNERTYRVSSISGTGTTGGVEPAWPLTANSTVTDNAGANQVVWTECSGQEAYCTAGNWSAAAAHMDVIFTNTNGRAALGGADWTFVASDHVEPTWASGRDWTRAGRVRVITVLGSSLPPVIADQSTAQITVGTSGASTITIAGNPDFDGFIFSCGSAGSQAHFQIGRSGANGIVSVRNGKIKLNNTATGSRIWLGNAGNGNLHLDNCPLEFGSTSQTITMNIASGFFTWINTPNGIQGSVPTSLFFSNFSLANTLIENVDLSAMSGTILTAPSGSNTWAGVFRVLRCKLHASATLASNWKLRSLADVLEFIGCDDGTSNKQGRITKATLNGKISTTYTEYHSAAMPDASGDNFCMVAQQSAAANGAPTRAYHNIIDLQQRWISTVDAPITATVQVAVEHTAMLGTSELWLEAVYYDSTTSTARVVAENATADILDGAGSVGTASTDAWTATARVNSENPAAGAIRSVSTNVGRLFMKQSGGAFDGSIPGAYATAVDGDTITDGTASVLALFRQVVSVTFTPIREGLVTFRLHIDHPATTSRYVLADPTVTLS